MHEESRTAWVELTWKTLDGWKAREERRRCVQMFRLHSPWKRRRGNIDGLAGVDENPAEELSSLHAEGWDMEGGVSEGNGGLDGLIGITAKAC